MNLRQMVGRNIRCKSVAMLATMAVLAGCQTAPSTRQSVPPLQLIQSEPLALADDCKASGSYFIDFKVLADGRTSAIQAPPGPACVQQALTTWVSSFRYAPPGQEMHSGLEWMMVTF